MTHFLKKEKVLISGGKRQPIDTITFDILVGIRYLSRVIIKTNRPFLYQTIIACHGRGGAE
jgi:hypothetical protein